jgi:hypothetical protein
VHTLTMSASFSPKRTLRSTSEALGTVKRSSKILFRSLSCGLCWSFFLISAMANLGETFNVVSAGADRCRRRSASEGGWSGVLLLLLLKGHNVGVVQTQGFVQVV